MIKKLRPRERPMPARLLSIGLVCLGVVSTAAAQNAVEGFRLTEPKTYRFQVTIQVTAPQKALQQVVATGPIPIDWPEQQIKLISERKTPGATTQEVPTPGQATLLVCQFPGVPAGGSALVERIYEITRYQKELTIPEAELRRAETIPKEVKPHLAAAPGIETSDRAIKKLHAELQDKQASGWRQTRIFYDWIRRNIRFQEGKFRGAKETYAEKIGDCEDQTALFVTLCRLEGIPARSVWIEGHAYAEFYLEDSDGRGYWIPAELTGPEWFGKTGQYDPILQKGDKFYDNIARRNVRYVPQSARAHGGAAQLEIIRVASGMTQE